MAITIQNNSNISKNNCNCTHVDLSNTLRFVGQVSTIPEINGSSIKYDNGIYVQVGDIIQCDEKYYIFIEDAEHNFKWHQIHKDILNKIQILSNDINDISSDNIVLSSKINNLCIFKEKTIKDILNIFSQIGCIHTSLHKLDDKLSNYIKYNDLVDSLSDYVKQDDLNNSLADYVKQDDLNNSLADYVKQDDLNQQISDYIISSQLDSAISNFITSSDISDIFISVDNLCSQISNIYTEITNIFSEFPETSSIYELSTAFKEIYDHFTDYYCSLYHENNAQWVDIKNHQLSIDYLMGKLTDIPNIDESLKILSNYVLCTDLYHILEKYALSDDVTLCVNTLINNIEETYYTSAYIDDNFYHKNETSSSIELNEKFGGIDNKIAANSLAILNNATNINKNTENINEINISVNNLCNLVANEFTIINNINNEQYEILDKHDEQIKELSDTNILQDLSLDLHYGYINVISNDVEDLKALFKKFALSADCEYMFNKLQLHILKHGDLLAHIDKRIAQFDNVVKSLNKRLEKISDQSSLKDITYMLVDIYDDIREKNTDDNESDENQTECNCDNIEN